MLLIVSSVVRNHLHMQINNKSCWTEMWTGSTLKSDTVAGNMMTGKKACLFVFLLLFVFFVFFFA